VVISLDEKRTLIATANKVKSTVDNLLMHLGADADNMTILKVMGSLVFLTADLDDSISALCEE